jgi:hypothetical protein
MSHIDTNISVMIIPYFPGQEWHLYLVGMFGNLTDLVLAKWW